MKAALKGHPSLLGIIVAVLYLFLVIGIYAIIASSKPSGLGYEWIPLIDLAMPWSLMGDNVSLPGFGFLTLLIFGFIANAGILYLLATLFEKFRRRRFSK